MWNTNELRPPFHPVMGGPVFHPVMGGPVFHHNSRAIKASLNPILGGGTLKSGDRHRSQKTDAKTGNSHLSNLNGYAKVKRSQ